LPEIIDYDMPFEGVAHNIVIVKINKTYPGQAFKVMNAMWGAGQMMFNKILIVVDKEVNTHDYKNITKQIIENVEPENDILFISGPLDVLDHSASKPTYGGKMGIDATIKFDEEIENNIKIVIKEKPIDLSIIKKKFEEIIELNYSIHHQILIISVKKKSKEQLHDFIILISDQKELASVKFCVLTDEIVDVNDVNMITWIASGNIDPKRDSVIIKGNKTSCSKIFIDATRKSAKKDNFKRDWPNIVVSDDKTIKSIDNLWKHLGLGEFIKSPSLKYRKLNTGDGAIAE
jgi:4-hydroxy-3-polyprenylbenzoate decarboxylase